MEYKIYPENRVLIKVVPFEIKGKKGCIVHRVLFVGGHPMSSIDIESDDGLTKDEEKEIYEAYIKTLPRGIDNLWRME